MFSDVICTYLYKIKARQERDAVLGWFLLGFALGGHHLGVGPLAACRQSNNIVRKYHRYFRKTRRRLLSNQAAQLVEAVMVMAYFLIKKRS